MEYKSINKFTDNACKFSVFCTLKNVKPPYTTGIYTKQIHVILYQSNAF